MTAGELRNIKLDNHERAPVRVYDAGIEESDPLHAEIVADGSSMQKIQRHMLRVRLMKLAEKRGLHISPYLDEKGLHIAQGCNCCLVSVSEKLLPKT